MSFAIIDKNCSEQSMKEIKNVLNALSVSVYKLDETSMLNDLVPTESNQLCIYIIPDSVGQVKYLSEFIREKQKVRQWLLLVVDTEGKRAIDQAANANDFKLMLSETEKEGLVFCGSDSELAKQIGPALRELRKKQKAITEVIVASSMSGVGRTTAIHVLQKAMPDYNFLPCDAEDLKEKAKYARKIILIGCEPKDFDYPSVKNAQERVIILCNKADKDPLRLIAPEGMKQSVLEHLNKNGWGLPEVFPAFYVCSMLYESFLQKVRMGELVFESLVHDSRFVMWDNFGLPCENREYTLESIEHFLEMNSVIEKGRQGQKNCLVI